MTVLPECPKCGYPVRKQACEQREGCPLPDVSFAVDIGATDEAACHTLFADDALDALQAQLDEAREELRVMTLQRDEWQGQASALKREVSVLKKKLAKVGG